MFEYDNKVKYGEYWNGLSGSEMESNEPDNLEFINVATNSECSFLLC
jgi:hypothetical protein